tara:strand:- start:1117 stop:1275 length:159 start_codon:yes stop_codon:yes gene_type:complete
MKDVLIVFLIVYNLYITYISYVVRQEITRLLRAEKSGARVSLAKLKEAVTPW